MVHYVNNFKVVLQNIIVGCDDEDAEIKKRADVIEKILNHIYKLQKENAEMKDEGTTLNFRFYCLNFVSEFRAVISADCRL